MKPLLKVSGGLGLAGILLGLALLLLACAGFSAAFYFSPLVILLEISAGILTIVSARRSPLVDDSALLAAIFIVAMGLLGGLLELGVWLRWPVLFNQH